MTQARILDERLAQRREFLSLAILLDIPREAIEERVMDRWVHVPSGRTYSASFNPPRHMGLDDETGEALSRRHDDNMVRGRVWQSRMLIRVLPPSPAPNPTIGHLFQALQ